MRRLLIGGTAMEMRFKDLPTKSAKTIFGALRKSLREQRDRITALEAQFAALREVVNELSNK